MADTAEAPPPKTEISATEAFHEYLIAKRAADLATMKMMAAYWRWAEANRWVPPGTAPVIDLCPLAVAT